MWNVEKWNSNDIIFGSIILDKCNWQERLTISAVFLIKGTMGDQISQTLYIPVESAKLNSHQSAQINRRINSQISI